MTTIAVILFIGGLLLGLAGFFANPIRGKLIGAGALLLFGGMLIGIGANPARDMPDGSPGMVALGAIMALIGIGLLVYDIIKSSADNKKRVVAFTEQQKIAFYKACVENGITECVGEKAIQKASLIAKQKNIKFTDVTALFNESKALIERSEQKKQDDELEKQKNSEKKLLSEMTRFASYTGREKRIAMLEWEKHTVALSCKAGSSDAILSLYGATQRKELDWATPGGIASGLAGPAAGLAVAMDVQAKNAEIRAQNAAMRNALAPALAKAMSNDAEERMRVERLQKQIDEKIQAAQTKLVADDSAESCFDRLSFKNTAVDVSKTGTCFVKTEAVLKNSFCIFDDVNSVVDGTVIARILDGQQEIGRAELVLPTPGISTYTSKLQGCCLFCGKPGAQYTVSFEAGNLWAMEQ